jgi:hypothetical protein
MSAFEWFGKNPEAARIFNEANSYKARSTHRAVVDVFDFTTISELTDVGGGLGGLMIEILKANPALRGTIAELPHVVAGLGTVIEENGLTDRLKAVECDFFARVPVGADAYLLSHVLHDWPDTECGIILGNCRDAAGPGGRLLIVEYIIPPRNTFSVAKLLDLEVLLMGGGRERTEEEFRDLLEVSGFALERTRPTLEGVSLMECVPI